MKLQCTCCKEWQLRGCIEKQALYVPGQIDQKHSYFFHQCSTSQLCLLILDDVPLKRRTSEFLEMLLCGIWRRNGTLWYFIPWSANQVLVSHCFCKVVESDLLLWRTVSWKYPCSSHVFKIKIRKNCYLPIFWVVYFTEATFFSCPGNKQNSSRDILSFRKSQFENRKTK